MRKIASEDLGEATYERRKEVRTFGEALGDRLGHLWRKREREKGDLSLELKIKLKLTHTSGVKFQQD